MIGCLRTRTNAFHLPSPLIAGVIAGVMSAGRTGMVVLVVVVVEVDSGTVDGVMVVDVVVVDVELVVDVVVDPDCLRQESSDARVAGACGTVVDPTTDVIGAFPVVVVGDFPTVVGLVGTDVSGTVESGGIVVSGVVSGVVSSTANANVSAGAAAGGSL